MYNLTFLSSQNLTFHNILWETLTYIAWFNSTDSIKYDVFLNTEPKTMNRIYLNNYHFECPNIDNFKISDCKCFCDKKIVATEILSPNKCACRTQMNAMCSIQIDCTRSLQSLKTSQFITSRFPDSPSTKYSCPYKNYQLMTLCFFSFYSGFINSTVNITNNLYYNKLQTISPVDYLIEDSSAIINNQYCSMPGEFLTISKVYSELRPFSFLRMDIMCLSIECPAFEKLICTQVTYSTFLNNIWGSVAIFSCGNNNLTCQTPRKVLKCNWNGTWNDTAPEEICLNFNQSISGNFNYSDWILRNCSLAYKNSSLYFLSINECLKLDSNFTGQGMDLINEAKRERLENITKNLKLELGKLEKAHAVRDKVGYGSGMVIVFICLIFIFLIFLADIIWLVRIIVKNGKSVKTPKIYKVKAKNQSLEEEDYIQEMYFKYKKNGRFLIKK